MVTMRQEEQGGRRRQQEEAGGRLRLQLRRWRRDGAGKLLIYIIVTFMLRLGFGIWHGVAGGSAEGQGGQGAGGSGQAGY